MCNVAMSFLEQMCYFLSTIKMTIVFTVKYQWVATATEDDFPPVKQNHGNAGWKKKNAEDHLFQLPTQTGCDHY